MDNEKRVSYNKYDAGKTFLLALFSPYIVIILLLFVFGSIMLLTKNPTLKESSAFDVFNALAPQIGFLIVFLLYNKVCKIDTKKAIKYNYKIDYISVIIVAVISILAIFGLNYFLEIFTKLFEVINYKQPSSLSLPLDNVWWYIVNVIVLAVFPAICEELIFRGMILEGLKDYGKTKAVIISALLFSLMHTSPLQTIYPFIMGVVLALVVMASNNLVYSIILHFINNFMVITINFISITTGFAFLPKLSILWTTLIGICAFIVTALVVYYLLRLLKKRNVNTNIESENLTISSDGLQTKTKSNMYLFAGIAVAVLLWIIVFISYMI